MNVFRQVRLKDGTVLEVFRFILRGKPEDMPEWVLPFARYDLPDCWGSYYSDLWEGTHDGCCDYLYVGCIGGVPCARMWFGFSLKTGSGNFGNVLTLPGYRRRGIMRVLLELCVADFHESGALFCSCDAEDSAAPAYAAYGFRKLFSETLHPMAIVAKTVPDFAAVVEKAYGRTGSAFVREGTFSDRFDCDKLLWYAPEVYGKVQRHPEFPDYLTLWPWASKNRVQIPVLETVSGFAAGFAFLRSGSPFVFLHPAFEDYRAVLLEKLRTAG